MIISCFQQWPYQVIKTTHRRRSAWLKFQSPGVLELYIRTNLVIAVKSHPVGENEQLSKSGEQETLLANLESPNVQRIQMLDLIRTIQAHLSPMMPLRVASRGDDPNSTPSDTRNCRVTLPCSPGIVVDDK